MTFVLVEYTLTKYRPLSPPLKSGISSFIFMYLLNTDFYIYTHKGRQC